MIKPLTSLRFFFAFMVFLSHLNFFLRSDSEILVWIYKHLLKEGRIGVNFFFILSGFILAYNYQGGILENKKSKKKFYIARFARIFPLHVLTLFLTIPLTYGIFSQNKFLWAKQLISNFTLTQSFVPLKEYYFSFNDPSWSISNEMFFYLIFPFLILLIPKIKNYKYVVIFLVIAIVPILMIFIPESYYQQIFYVNPVIRSVDFILGIILYNIYQDILKKKRKINYNFLEISAIIILLLFYTFHESVLKVVRYSLYYWVPISYLIISFSFQKGIVSKFLSKKMFIYLGEISFGFYMFHLVIIKYSSLINAKFLHIENKILLVIIYFTISLIVSHFSFLFFEKPLSSYIKRKLK